jgi:hypothetical protein
MKKIYINETSLGNIKEYGLLPDFLFKMVKDHKTSLGDNEAFPKIGEYPFDYSIIKKRLKFYCNKMLRNINDIAIIYFKNTLLICKR